MDLLDSRQHLDFAYVEFRVGADAAENGLARARGAVDFEAHLDQSIDHMLDLIFPGGILHRYDHELALLTAKAELAAEQQVLRFAQDGKS
jgi:hypothetical protein